MMQNADSATAGQFTYIGPVSPPQLSKAAGKGQMDQSSEQIRDREWQSYIRERRRQLNADRHPGDARPLDVGDQAPDDLTGIALSGGGIRSATFGLGVLQALAHHDLLRRFDYLSTVSGGGYIGSSLTWLTSKLAAGRAAATRPARTTAGRSCRQTDSVSGLPTRPRRPAPARPRLSLTAPMIRGPRASQPVPAQRPPCSAISASTAII
jgi:hypothetical protein